jgi:mono/diheme cytochrome c family protein
MNKYVLSAFVVLAICATGPQQAAAQEGQAAGAFSVDAGKAKQGKALFASKGCTACHTIGKGRSAGPDLAGVTVRRENAWLHTFLKDPPAVLASDPIGQELLKEYKGMKMPNLKLTDDQIDALIHHLADAGKVKEK